MSERAWEPAADRLGQAAAADGEPTRWFEELWSAAARDELDTPWSRTQPYPPVADLVAAQGDGIGRRGVVVGAGLGADAEHLAERGWATTAFDVSASAVDLARGRHPDTVVDYRVADLFALPDDLVGAFDLVLEVFTVQALPPVVREEAAAAVRSLLAPGGTLLAVQVVREAGESPDDGPPWLLDAEGMRVFEGDDVVLDDLERGPVPNGRALFLATLRRSRP
ncbi:class I SAM-dependent methyltransferase [Oryzobacter telluris]|uniref:class I SAM-dependent methyltransferase n=1 Tax=Oryzobacter telluris TaxID=3149179 RepID=UPI00370D30BA